MVTALLSMALLAPPSPAVADPPKAPPSYATVVLQALDGAAVQWVKKNARTLKTAAKPREVIVLELGIDSDGAVQTLGLVDGAGPPLDDLARSLVLDIEPFAKPSGELIGPGERLTCLVRMAMGGGRKPSLVQTVACLAPGEAIADVAGLEGRSADAAWQLFAGWSAQRDGQADLARRRYRRAVAAAPTWDFANRALGLALVAEKQAEAAMPYLRIYVDARKPPADVITYQRELSRYAAYLQKKAEEEKRVRERLSKRDIALGIKKGYALLEPCLKRARKERLLAVNEDTVILTWTVTNEGNVAKAHVDGPNHLAMTDFAECVERAVGTWRFPRFSQGTEITARQVPIKVRGSHPEPTKVAAAVDPEPEPDEPVTEGIAQCMRSAQEVGAHIRRSFGRLNACVAADRKRNPKAGLPDSIPIFFVIDRDGGVRSVNVDHRFFREGPFAECAAKALEGDLGPSPGADCPAEFALDLRSLEP